MHAILGASAHCIALHASDLCVPLVALDAVVHAQGTDGRRAIPLTEFYRLPGGRPDLENVLAHGELITAIEIPLLPAGARSGYLKVRDRASYEFALTSAAVALLIEDGVMTEARVALGGVGTIPWRAAAAEEVLIGAAPAPPCSARLPRPRSSTLHRAGDGVQGRARQADNRAALETVAG
jgi:xanthine dehydrogenase YagS FAD-binding subunit